MRRSLLLLLALASTCRAGALFREGDAVSFYKGTNTPPAGWTHIVFDDSGWSTGAVGIGYGDVGERTDVSDMSNSFASIFLRRSFTVADTNAVSRLTLAVDGNDGWVAYLNGLEVYRTNLPAGAIAASTLATRTNLASRAANGVEKVFLALNPSLLVNGTNVLAVSGHNVRTNSLDFLLMAELYTNVTLVRGPNLSLQHDRQVTVLWKTDTLTDSIVEYGLTTAYELGTVSNGALVRQHVLELPALPTGTSYQYRIRSGGVILATNRFVAPAESSQPFRFAVIGDFGSIYNNTRDVARRVGMQNPDLLLSVGDNIYNYGQPGSYDEQWFTMYTQTMSRAPMMPVMGDHDIVSFNGAPFTNNLALPTNGPAGFGERCYSFDFGNVHFVGIDNNPYNPGNAGQMNTIDAWVSNNLAASTQLWKIAYFGYPALSSWGDHDEDVNTKARLVPIFERFGVDFVFQGDNHWFERMNPRYGVNYVTTGGGGAALAATVNERYPYSFVVSNQVHSFTMCEVSGSVFRLRGIDQNGVFMEDYVYDKAHAFRMDGQYDSTNWVRVNTGLTFSASIRSNWLYVACNDAGESSDHFIYLADHLSTNRPANWNKNATAMQWTVFLADENDNGEHGWYDSNGTRITNPAVARSATFGVYKGVASTNALEGFIDLRAIFTNFPARLHAAAVPFQTASGGVLVTSGQCPPPATGPGNSGSNVDSNEFYGFNTRDIALDPPVAHAGAPATVEAGAWATLISSNSTSPSGYALSVAWSQVSGPAGIFTGASFAVTENIPSSTTAVLRLVVNDTRFDATSVVSVAVTPLVDSDGDGLSDSEELTGNNNVITAADPAGRLSNPALADSDGDGVNDGEEALAGTVATNAASVFAVAVTEPGASGLVLTWSSVSNRDYAILSATNPAGWPSIVESNLLGIPPLNSFTVPVNEVQQYFWIRTSP